MLYVNGKRLENADQYWKDKYEEVIDRLWKASKDKNKFSVVFTVAPHRIITQETVNGGKVHTTGTELVNLTRTIRVKDKDGRERNVNFVYSESPLDEKDGKVNAKDQTTLHRMFGDNNITETIRDEELAFFLYFVHPKFGEEGSKKPYYLIDERSRAEKKVELAQDDVEFKYLLYFIYIKCVKSFRGSRWVPLAFCFYVFIFSRQGGFFKLFKISILTHNDN